MRQILVVDKLANYLRKGKQFIRFLIVGVTNLIVSLMTYYLVIYIGWHYQVANILGFITGSINGYVWNKSWVFKKNKSGIGSFVKFYSTYLCTWLLGSVLLWLEIEILRISELIVPFINVFITTPINYLFNKHWTFKSNK